MENSETMEEEPNKERPEEERIKRSVESMKNQMKLTEDEINYRMENFDKADVVNEYQKFFKCTRCEKNCQALIKKGKTVSVHPLLGVIMCDSCCDYYGDGEFSLDSEGEDKYCRWCGDGGVIFGCSKCICGFCEKCINYHFGKDSLEKIKNDDDWVCYFCNNKPLWHLRSICSLAEQASKNKKEELKNVDQKGRKSNDRKKANGDASWKDTTSNTINSSDFKTRKKKRKKFTRTNNDHSFKNDTSSSETESRQTRSKRKSWKRSKESEESATDESSASRYPKKKPKFETSSSDSESDGKENSSFRNKRGRVLEKLRGIWKMTQTAAEVGLNSSKKRLKRLSDAGNFATIESLQKEFKKLEQFLTVMTSPLNTVRDSVDSVTEDFTFENVKDERAIFRRQESKIKTTAKKLLQDSDDENVGKESSEAEDVAAVAAGDSSKEKEKKKHAKEKEEKKEKEKKEEKEKEKKKDKEKKKEKEKKEEKEASGKEDADGSSHNSESLFQNISEQEKTEVKSSEQVKPLIKVKSFAKMFGENVLEGNAVDDEDEVQLVEAEPTEKSIAVDEYHMETDSDKDVDDKKKNKKKGTPSENDESKVVDEEQKKKKASKNSSEDDGCKAAEEHQKKKKKRVLNSSSEDDECKAADEQQKKEEASKSSSEDDKCKDMDEHQNKKKKKPLNGSSESDECKADDEDHKKKEGSNSSSEDDNRKAVGKRNKKQKNKMKASFEKFKEKRDKFLKEKEKQEKNKKLKEVKKKEMEEKSEEEEEEEEKNGSEGGEEEEKSEKKKVLNSDSDSEQSGEKEKKKSGRRKRIIASSDEENGEKAEDEEKSGNSGSGNDSDHKVNSPVISSGETSSDEATKKQSKYKRIRKKKKKRSSSEDEDDDDDDDEDGKKKKGRKNIKKILKKDSLHVETKEALKNEEDRRKRLEERQKLFEELFPKDGESKRLILDFDAETKEPLVSVHKKLVKKLKPHQMKGVKFMWDNCFESVQRLEEDTGSGCILAHCMGLGKTLQVVTLVHTVMTHELGVNTVLIVCPLSTVKNWINEFEMWLQNIHTEPITLYELVKYKKQEDRCFYLKEWHENGGVLVLSYDMFRTLTNGLTKASKSKSKSKARGKKKAEQVFEMAFHDPGPDLVICDEGHLLKNEDTALSKCMNLIKTSRRIVLTGTPLQNNLLEYHCMVQFVKPNILGTKKEFSNRFVNPINNGQFEDSTELDVKIMKRRSHVLHSMLKGCVQRFDYSVLTPFLPEKHEYVLSISLTETQATAYRNFIANLSGKSAGGTRSTTLFNDYHVLQRIWTHPRALLMHSEKVTHEETDSEGSLKDFVVNSEESSEESSGSEVEEIVPRRKRILRSNANDPEVQKEIEEEEKESAIKHWWDDYFKESDYEDIRHSNKLVILFNLLKYCGERKEKVLVFSQSLYSLDLIEYFLSKIDECSDKDESSELLCGHKDSWVLGSDYFRLDGGTSSENRSIWCNYFNKESNTRARLFLISTRAGGLGINLYGANRVVIFDASWNPSHDLQSIFRVYRFGQKKTCYIYRFLAEATMEEKIYQRQVAKLSLAHRVVDEHQIERHYSMVNLQELYNYDPVPKESRKLPKLPKDKVFADLLSDFKDEIVSYHEHDSLLENQEEEELSEEERKAAWKEYEDEKTIKAASFNQMLYQQQLQIAAMAQAQAQVQGIMPEIIEIGDNSPMKFASPAFLNLGQPNAGQSFVNPMFLHSSIPPQVLLRGTQIGVIPIFNESTESYFNRVKMRERWMQGPRET